MASPSMILSLLGTLDDHDDSAHLEKLYSGVAAAAYTGVYYSYRYGREESSADISPGGSDTVS